MGNLDEYGNKKVFVNLAPFVAMQAKKAMRYRELDEIKNGILAELERRILKEEEKPPIFPATQVDEVIGNEELMNDPRAIKVMLSCWIVDRPEDVSDILENSLYEVSDDIKDIDAELCREYAKSGVEGYIKLVEELIVKYGKDFILNNFGEIIRHRVPEYSYENLDGLNLEDEETVNFIIEQYPQGFAEQKGISPSRILKSLEECEEELSVDRLSAEISKYEEAVPFACAHIIKNEVDFEDMCFCYGWDECEKEVVRYYMAQGQELPWWAKNKIEPGKLEIYINEIRLELAATAFAETGITIEEITAQKNVVGSTKKIVEEQEIVQ